MKGHTVGHPTHWVLAFENLELRGSVLIKELVDGEEATTNLDLDLVPGALYEDTLGAELVDALGLAHEHDFQLLAVGVVVDVLRQLLVDHVVLHGDVDGNARLQVDDVLAELVNLIAGLGQPRLVVLHLLQHFKLCLLRFVVFLLELADVGRSALKLDLKLLLGFLHAIVVCPPHVALILNVSLFGKVCVQLEHSALQPDDSLLALAQTYLQLVNFSFVCVALLLHHPFVFGLHASHLLRQFLL